MNRFLLFLAFLVLFLLPVEAQAQTQFQLGPRIGIDVGDVEELFIGADARIDAESLPVTINPTFDFYFTDDPLTFWGLSANALYPFGVDNEAFTPYAGAGLGLYRTSVDDQEVDTPFGDVTVEGGSSTDVGLNLLFGAEFAVNRSFVPFVEAQYSPVFTEGETTNLFNVKAGLLFGL